MAEPVFEYKITADDYLTHQLFGASRNEDVKKQRRKGLILWTSTFFILALFFLWQGNKYMAIYFALFGIGFIFVYPFYSRWIYKRYYRRYIDKMLKSQDVENMCIHFEGEEIIISNGANEGRMKIADVIKIEEIPSHVFLKLNEGKNIIIPKLKVKNPQELQQQIIALTENFPIEYSKYPDWKW